MVEDDVICVYEQWLGRLLAYAALPRQEVHEKPGGMGPGGTAAFALKGDRTIGPHVCQYVDVYNFFNMSHPLFVYPVCCVLTGIRHPRHILISS